MARAWDRRDFLCGSATALSTIAMPSLGRADGNVVKTTFTYKKVGNCEIKADVHANPQGRDQPVAVWIHGGALIMGDRRGLNGRLLAELIEAGYVVVSIDYRLAPETKLPAILEDVRDAFAWIREEGPRTFGTQNSGMVVLGGSAGGYLTLVSGYLISPRPTALVSFYGYGDIVGPWYSRPDPFYRRQTLVTESEARGSVGTAPISEPLPPHQRFRFYLYCRQNGLWPREVAGIDPDADPKAFDRFCPIRNVSAEYPPTLLVHGTKDTDVPHEQSELMDRELERHHVAHEFMSIPGAGHGLTGIAKAENDRVHGRVLAFLRKHAG